MIISAGQTVLVTGASGGIGTFITKALAELQVKLALVAYPGEELDALRASLEKQGVEAVAWVADLRKRDQRHLVLQGVRQKLGEVDVLINNAGVEYTSAFHKLGEENLCDILNINLAVPMDLTRLVLPEMLRRGVGHIVNISSLAGKSGPAFQEPYAATKAALVAFTTSLRASYRGTGVSASVVTPGFVEAGIYERIKSRSGCTAPPLLGTSKPEAVGRAVLEVIQHDQLERIVNPIPVRPLLALSALFPGFGEWLAERTGGNQFFRMVEGRLQETPTEQLRKGC
jgi:short-subunit dehydrogenase